MRMDLHNPCLCPHCGHTVDARTHVGRHPAPAEIANGDTTICLYCGGIGQFVYKGDKTVIVEKLSKKAEAEVLNDPFVQLVLVARKLAAAELKRERNRSAV